MKRLLNLTLLILLPILLVAQVPERVILNITDEPSTSIAVTWRMAGEGANASVQYAEATRWTEFTKQLSAEKAKTEKVELKKNIFAYHYSAVIRGLKPHTRYVYRVGSDSVWTEWNQFSTSSEKAEPFSFVWFGDPQNDIAQHCSRMFRQAFQTAGDAKFWLFSGDITTEPEDDLMGELFTATGFIFRTIPSALVPGNHDMAYLVENGQIVRNKKGHKMRVKFVSLLWHAHYTLPENGISGMEETSYTFDYQGVRFIMMNSNTRLEEQAAWMEKLLAANANRWTVVTFHHPLYSSGADRDDKETRNAFLPLIDKYHVDLVLTGHDHTYSRSYKLRNGTVVPNTEKGTVYVLSVSGPKQYELTPVYKNLMAKIAGNIQLFQVVSIDGKTLNYKCYTAAGELFDSFALTK
jgi:acid phosphatase type 7